MDESYEYSDEEVDDELTLNETESKTTMMMMGREAVTAQLMYQHNCNGDSYHDHDDNNGKGNHGDDNANDD